MKAFPWGNLNIFHDVDILAGYTKVHIQCISVAELSSAYEIEDVLVGSIAPGSILAG